MAIQIDDVIIYSRIDYVDEAEKKFLEDLILQAQIYIDKCVGKDYKKDEDLVKLSDLLSKKIVGDLYDNRELYLENRKGGYDKISNTILDILANCGDEVE